MGKKPKTKTCVRCGDKFPAARPRDHCTKDDCVTGFITERRSLMAITKSGFTPVFKSDHSSLARTTKG